ncbi:hypothetical protein LOK49_LG02G01924 [Camellia lanceoleosa]|uniref:Uncharacterized protein n=1 Tax=Camellia lanceoleosa TaxID=1840588 RepID=A0ACC0II79_9ERIC|nr:hypothetical protein LOK49_LG02G01924 [Camellia lanceoleosa]
MANPSFIPPMVSQPQRLLQILAKILRLHSPIDLLKSRLQSPLKIKIESKAKNPQKNAAHLQQGIGLLLSAWTALQMAFENYCGGPDSLSSKIPTTRLRYFLLPQPIQRVLSKQLYADSREMNDYA